MKTNVYDVFISYSKMDSAFVRSLTKALCDLGLHIWYDEEKIRWGDEILNNIENALLQSRYFLVVVSPDYLSSQWGNFEMGVALGRESRIFPIYVKDVEKSQLPPWIAKAQGFSAKEMPVEKIASSLADIIKKEKNRSSASPRISKAQH